MTEVCSPELWAEAIRLIGGKFHHNVTLNNEFSPTDVIAPLTSAIVSAIVGGVSAFASYKSAQASMAASTATTRLAHNAQAIQQILNLVSDLVDLTSQEDFAKSRREIDNARSKLSLLVDPRSVNGEALLRHLEQVYASTDSAQWRRSLVELSRASFTDQLHNL